MGRPDDRTGTWLFIHQVTGTYLIPTGYTINPDESVKNSDEYPLRTSSNQQGHLWDLTKQKDGSYLISTHSTYGDTGKNLYLEAPSNTATDRNARVKQQYRSDSDLQNWILEPVSDDNKTYALRPQMFDNHALGLEDHHCERDRYVIASCTFGKPTHHHYWRLCKLEHAISGRE